MFLTAQLEQIDPALLAFIKCHVTSPLKWEALRVLATNEGTWLSIEWLAHATHRPPSELMPTMAELVTEGVVERDTGDGTQGAYRLPLREPTSVVLQRLIEAATHSQELRAIIAAYLQQRSKAGAQFVSPSTATAAA